MVIKIFLIFLNTSYMHNFDKIWFKIVLKSTSIFKLLKLIRRQAQALIPILIPWQNSKIRREL